MSCIEIYRYSKCPAIWRFLHNFILQCFIHNYVHTYRSVEWYRHCTDEISCYCLMFKSYWEKKNFWGRWQAHCVPNIAHFKLLFWSYENAFSGKCFNAVSLRVPSTWPLNCVHIILIHCAESSVWYSINILPFHVQKLFNCYSKYVWYSVFFGMQIQDQKYWDAHCKIVHWNERGMTHVRLWSSKMMHNIRTKQVEEKWSLHQHNFLAGSRKTLPLACHSEDWI